MVEGPVLLVHPPNSSSAATFGWTFKPPVAPGTMDVLAKEEDVLAKEEDVLAKEGDVLAKEEALEFPHPKSLLGGLTRAGLF